MLDSIYTPVFWLAGAVFTGALLLTLWRGIASRERPSGGAAAGPSGTRREVLWAVIPVVIAAAVAVPTFRAMFETSSGAPDGALRVTATRHPSWLEFEYPDLGIVSVNEIHVPAGVPVALTTRSPGAPGPAWVPQIGGQTVATSEDGLQVARVDGSTFWFTPGEPRVDPYGGRCAESCGGAPADLSFRLWVDSEEDFRSWVRAQQAAPGSQREVALVTGE